MIKLSDFAKMQGVTSRAVQQMLKKYEKDLEGHFERKGQDGTWFDETAEKFLRSKMLKKPVVVYDETATPLLDEIQKIKDENKELRNQVLDVYEQLISAQDRAIDFQRQFIESDEKLRAALEEKRLLTAGKDEAEKALLAMRERAETAEDVAAATIKEADEVKAEATERIHNAEIAAETAVKGYEAAKAEAERNAAEADELKAALEAMKKRNLFERIFNKGI